MTEHFIQKRLWNKYSHNRYKFLNTFFFTNESDFLTVTAAGYFNEFEIKITKSDFMADFKKPRHKKMLASYLKTSEQHVANRFWYVVPDGLQQSIEVPAYAGLMVCMPYGLKEIKSAPLLHSNKHKVERLLSKMYFAYENITRNFLFKNKH